MFVDTEVVRKEIIEQKVKLQNQGKTPNVVLIPFELYDDILSDKTNMIIFPNETRTFCGLLPIPVYLNDKLEVIEFRGRLFQ